MKSAYPLSKETRLLITLIITSVLGVILHNVGSIALNQAERMFYLVTFISVVGFIIIFLKALYEYHTKGSPNDLWIIGYAGFLGFLGPLPQTEVALFGFFGFFGLFSLKQV